MLMGYQWDINGMSMGFKFNGKQTLKDVDFKWFSARSWSDLLGIQPKFEGKESEKIGGNPEKQPHWINKNTLQQKDLNQRNMRIYIYNR